MSFDSFKVERGETKTRAKAPPFSPPPFLWGERKISRCSCSAVAGFWLFVSAGGQKAGKQAA